MVFELDDATINKYQHRGENVAGGDEDIANARENYVLQSSTVYTKQQHNVRLVYHGSQQYSIEITEQDERKSVKNFTASGVFLLVLQLVGISANDNTDILVTFTNILDALTFYTRGYLHTSFLVRIYRAKKKFKFFTSDRT